MDFRERKKERKKQVLNGYSYVSQCSHSKTLANSELYWVSVGNIKNKDDEIFFHPHFTPFILTPINLQRDYISDCLFTQ